MAKKVVEESVLHETDCCVHDAVAHLNLDVFTAYTEVELAYGQCVILEIGIVVEIDSYDRGYFPAFSRTLTVLLASNKALPDRDKSSAVIM